MGSCFLCESVAIRVKDRSLKWAIFFAPYYINKDIIGGLVFLMSIQTKVKIGEKDLIHIRTDL